VTGSSRRIASLGSGLVIVIWGMPLLWMVWSSFKSASDFAYHPNSVFFVPTASSYAALGGIWVPMWRSLEVAVGTTLITMALTVLTCYGLTHIRGRLANVTITVSLAFLIVLQMIPQPTILIPLYEVLAAWGLDNSILGLILADTALALPLAILLLRPFFRVIPKGVEEAAHVDGAGATVTLIWIVLPLLRNGISTVAALIFMITWGEFVYAVTFLSSSNLFPVSVELTLQVGNQYANWGQLMALATVTSLPILAAFFLSWKGLKEGLAMGAMR
jgi:multiple sugar transport system permease protein